MAGMGADEDDCMDWSPQELQRCNHGATCYRQNPEHFANYAHPSGLLEQLGLVPRSSAKSPSSAGAAPIDKSSDMSDGDDREEDMSMSFGEVRIRSSPVDLVQKQPPRSPDIDPGPGSDPGDASACLPACSGLFCGVTHYSPVGVLLDHGGVWLRRPPCDQRLS